VFWRPGLLVGSGEPLGIHFWLCPTGPGPGGLADGICKVRRHLWQIPWVVGTSSWAHHTVMNEFPGPGQQPAGNPRRLPTRSERTEMVRRLHEKDEERARGQAVPADRPVRVRIVWDAKIPAPVSYRLSTAQALTPGAPYTWVKPTRGRPGTCRAPAFPRSCSTTS
jgi:hypothetical protein